MGRSRLGHGQGVSDQQLDVGGLPHGRLRPGRIRRDLDRQVHDTRRDGTVLPAGLLAAARSLADELDIAHAHVLARQVAGQAPSTGLLMAVRGLYAEYRETHARVFPAAGGARDPLADLAAIIGAASLDDDTDQG